MSGCKERVPEPALDLLRHDDPGAGLGGGVACVPDKAPAEYDNLSG